MDQDPLGDAAMGPADSFEGESDTDALQARIAALEEMVGAQKRDIGALRDDVDEGADDFIPDEGTHGPVFDEPPDDLAIVDHPWKADISGNTIAITPGIVWLENVAVAITPGNITATAAGKAWIKVTGSASGGVGVLTAEFGYGTTYPTITDAVRYCRLFEWTWVAGTPTGTATLLEQYQWSDVAQFADNAADNTTGIIYDAGTVKTPPETVNHPWKAVINGANIDVTAGWVWAGNAYVTRAGASIAQSVGNRAWIEMDFSLTNLDSAVTYAQGNAWPTWTGADALTHRFWRLFEWTGGVITMQEMHDDIDARIE